MYILHILHNFHLLHILRKSQHMHQHCWIKYPSQQGWNHSCFNKVVGQFRSSQLPQPTWSWTSRYSWGTRLFMSDMGWLWPDLGPIKTYHILMSPIDCGVKGKVLNLSEQDASCDYEWLGVILQTSQLWKAQNSEISWFLVGNWRKNRRSANANAIPSDPLIISKMAEIGRKRR